MIYDVQRILRLKDALDTFEVEYDEYDFNVLIFIAHESEKANTINSAFMQTLISKGYLKHRKRLVKAIEEYEKNTI